MKINLIKFGIDKILDTIPQRPPFLLVDRILDVKLGGCVTAEKAISLSDFCYQNIRSVTDKRQLSYPVSALMEGLSQSAGFLLKDIWPELSSDQYVVMFGAFAGVEIFNTCGPGDVVEFEVKLNVANKDSAVLSGFVHCKEKPILKANSISVAVRKRND